MPLVDFQIEAICLNGVIEPFDPSLINPASLDVRIGTNLVLETPDGWRDWSIAGYTEERPFWVMPGDFLLAETMETFNMPETIAAEFRLKSSRAREGWDNALAVWLDPGWSGSKLTLELVNNCRFHRLPIYPGRKIGQIVFHECDRPTRSYKQTGRYNNDKTVMQSKG